MPGKPRCLRAPHPEFGAPLTFPLRPPHCWDVGRGSIFLGPTEQDAPPTRPERSTRAAILQPLVQAQGHRGAAGLGAQRLGCGRFQGFCSWALSHFICFPGESRVNKLEFYASRKCTLWRETSVPSAPQARGSWRPFSRAWYFGSILSFSKFFCHSGA